MPSVQKKVLDQMTKRPKIIVLDTMNFWMDHFMEDLKESLKEIDVLTINDEEARQLSVVDVNSNPRFFIFFHSYPVIFIPE